MTIECLDDSSKDGVPEIIREHFQKMGVSHKAKLCVAITAFTPIKLTGKKSRIMFKRSDESAGFLALHYNVWPIGRSSAIAISIRPSQEVDYDDLISKEMLASGQAQKKAVPEVQHPPKQTVFEHQIYQATVVGHLPYGLILDICGNEGHVPLDDFSPDYNPKNMGAYPVGLVLKQVLVCDTSAVPVLCSLKVDAMKDTSFANDKFTGKVNPDGSFPLAGFAYDYHRVFDLIYHLAVASVDSGYVMSRDGAMDEATKYLKNKYGAKSVDTQKVGLLLHHLCTSTKAIGEPVLTKEDDGGFRITEFGRKESGADEPEAVRTISPVETFTFDSEHVGREIETQPEDSAPPLQITGMQPTPYRLPASDRPVSLYEVSTYYAKMTRSVQVASEIVALERESRELEEWLADNVAIKDATSDCKSVLDELLQRLTSGK